jgi:DNA-binding CsgD family transcriptional regulator
VSALDPKQRAMIDEAVAAGRVTVVPRGVSGLVTPVWCAKAKRLVYPDGKDRLAKSMKRGWHSTHRHRPAHPDVQARRDQVLAHHEAGRSVPQIMAAMGLAEAMVRQDLKRMQIQPNPARQVAAQDAQAQVRALAGLGKQTTEIALATGLNPERVYRIGLRLDLGLEWSEAGVRRAQLAALDADVARLAAEGLTKAAIRLRLDVSAARVRESIKRQKLDVPTQSPRVGRAARDAARVAEVRRLAGEGLTRSQIAAAVGILPSTVRVIARRSGFTVAPDAQGPRKPTDYPAARRKTRRVRPAEALRQRVVALRAKGMTYRQIAEATGLRVGTVGYHLQMAGEGSARRACEAAA